MKKSDARFLKNEILLITGGTGSFGNTVLKKLLESELREIRIFSRDEKKQEDMRLSYSDNRIKYIIGDIRNYQSIYDALSGATYVFHAAALKQVPSCEFYPMEAVSTNILGAENVMRAAVAQKVKKCIVLSTDKAVYPINAMGISKAMMERIMLAKSRLGERENVVLCATRYGNVMGSRGSVIPLFINQAINGEDITITDPGMTRFLMSLEESVDLVLHAYENAVPGEIYVQKSPACTVLDLALAIKEIFNSRSKIQVIGTRHGEKLYESLVSREEMVRAIEGQRYFRIRPDERELDYKKYFTEGEVQVTEASDYTSHNTNRMNVEQIEKILLSLDLIKNKL
jgi:UDP-N-acetylglucosamine 4,6-dehydratase